MLARRVTGPFAAAAAFVAAACASEGRSASRDPAALFELVSPARSGVTFANELPDDTAFNILNYLYFYTGGGVAAGDVNGDGLPDLFFTSNAGPDRLYLNKGDLRFEDVTNRAGVAGRAGWTTGVTMADVNGDGHLDIHVSAVSYLSKTGENALFINNGDGTFADSARAYGLAHTGYSTQALFFDYDRDGDLDVYLLNHSVHTERGVSSRPQRETRHPRAGDKLFRNDGNRFTDVSASAGIHGGVEGYGLGVVASDFDDDGCIDLFVANDFQENDFLYRNNCDGTFSETITRSMGHTSRFSMGVDAADFNNDGRIDLFVADMLPEREEILKTSANAENFNVFNLKTRVGYHPQYARNTLQLNRGDGLFSEIGYLAGVYATDWSWAPLFADLDNDGLKDLVVTNGIYRRPNDLDYINFVGNEAVQAALSRGITQREMSLLEKMPRVPLAKYAFRNRGDLRFTNVAGDWGLDDTGFSNGAAYADLDNDGDLDLVINNVNAPASIYRNRASERSGGRFVRVELRGDGANTGGVGARVTIHHGATRQVQEQSPTRGFQSSVDPRLHFGLGRDSLIDSLVVRWPDGRVERRAALRTDSAIVLRQSDARTPTGSGSPRVAPLLETAPDAGIDFAHRENDFQDYNREPLMPHRLSTEGPALAVGDVNGDGLDDVFLGGGKWQPSALFVQTPRGGFARVAVPAFAADSLAEDVDAVFFDADGDRDLDLYVVSAGNEFGDGDAALLDRLYINDGAGRFRRDAGALPAHHDNGGCVAAADYDRDGDVDLFVGSRVVARSYGLAPASRLLRNDGSGRFADVTRTLAPALQSLGMIAACVWLDADGDGTLDLVAAGEWTPVHVFSQRNGRFEDRTSEMGLAETTGWWNSIETADVNGDGRSDLVLGNLGLNSYIRASREQPARLYVHDFGQNGTIEQVLTFYKNGISYPVATRDELVRPIPALRAKYPSYSSFGAARVEQLFPQEELRAARVLEARTFASAVAINTGKGFELTALPLEAQLAPVYATLSRDMDGDGSTDILLGGNFHGVTPTRGRYDASHGLLLRAGANGALTAAERRESGVHIEGEVRAIRAARTARGTVFIVARNNATPQVLRPIPPTNSQRGTRR